MSTYCLTFSGKTGILSPLCYESDLKVDGEPRLQIRRSISNKKKDAHKGHLSSCCGKTGIFRSYFTKVTPTDYQLVTFLKYPDFCRFLPITVPVASRYAGLLTR